MKDARAKRDERQKRASDKAPVLVRKQEKDQGRVEASTSMTTGTARVLVVVPMRGEGDHAGRARGSDIKGDED